jgi:hypothetical protein
MNINEAVPKLQLWNSNLRCNRKTGVKTVILCIIGV